MYTLNDVPSRLEPMANVVSEEGRKLGFYEFELERNSGVSSLAFYVNGENKIRLHVGMKYLSYLQDNRNIWPELADGIVKGLVKHEKNGHFNDNHLNFWDIYHRMKRNGFNTDTEETYMIHERQANLNELCLEKDVAGKGVASKIATILWSRAAYVPASYMEYLIRHDKLESLCATHSFIGMLAKQCDIEEKVKAVSYSKNHTDKEKVKTILGEWAVMYLDEVYPWLNPKSKENVVKEVLKIDEEYRNKKLDFDSHATEQ